MKHIFVTTFMLAASAGIAQDTLYTISGQKIPAKVIEINSTEIKYKKATNLDGPVYVVDKTDVALIEYKNGTKELYGNGEGAELNNSEQVVINDPQPKQRVNIVIGGGWGWAGWPLFNTWNGWGGYRVYPRWHHHHHRYYKPYRHKRIHYGRRGR